MAIFLTIVIANMGGKVDELRMGEIRETIVQTVRNNPANRSLPPDQFQALIEDLVYQEAHAQGLDRPFMVRVAAYMKNALTLDLGSAIRMTSDTGSKQVRLIILERLPPTLLFWGTSGLLLFFVEISVALSLSRRYGSFWDKFFITMAPLSTTPGWFFGIFLILIFASALKILPFGGMVDAPVPKTAAWRATGLRLLNAFDFISAADARTSQALARIAGRRIASPGNLKLAAPAPPAHVEERAALASQIGARPVWLAASTHAGEDEIVLAAHSLLRAEHADALLLIAPRHPERGEAVAALAGGAPRRALGQPVSDAPVYIADTLGELGLFYSLVPTALVAGSLLPHLKGHNPVEPAKLGAAILREAVNWILEKVS